MKFLVKVSFAAADVTGQAGRVIDLPADSEYARKFCEPVEEPVTEPAPKPKAKAKAK